jgi:phosphoribosylglycinamide formyltransferase-1
VLPDETEFELHERIKVVERELLIKTVADIAKARVELNVLKG